MCVHCASTIENVLFLFTTVILEHGTMKIPEGVINQLSTDPR